MQKKTKWLIIVGSVLIIAVVAFLANYFLSVKAYQNAIANMSYHNADASQVLDGTYIGECDVQFIYAKVEVTVKDGIITNISLLEHRNDRGGAVTGIEQRIVEQQRVDIDAVSGATNSSKVIKKAVDNAMNNAIDS